MKNKKRAAVAIAAVVLLVFLYIATLIFAFLSIPGWEKLFRASLGATIAIPILAWILLLLYKK